MLRAGAGKASQPKRESNNRTMKICLAAFIVLCCPVRCHTKLPQQEKQPGPRTVDIQAVEGMATQFPCDIVPQNNDKVYMAFWFKDDAGIPLYSFDVRGKHLTEARHWSAPEVFGPRAYFATNQEPAALIVRDVKRRDEGVYRCRVDFRNTQTMSFKYNLTVIVPPEKPVIVDRYGRVINSSMFGPHEEGEDMLLTCRVLGGRPEPSVRWLVNGVLVDEEYEHNTGDVIENRLLWPSISRTDYAAIFTCQATNTKLMLPKEMLIALDMYLRPLTIEIKRPEGLAPDAPLVAEHKYDISCETAGSRPPATIVWSKNRKQITRTMGRVTTSNNTRDLWSRKQHLNKDDWRLNITSSNLSFVASMEDNGKAITCRAENPNVTSLFIETSWTVNVVYPPVVKLRLGSTLTATEIKEGDDVYFECHVHANPAVRKLSWLHDDRPLPHNASARIVHSNQSLVMQSVTRQSGGRYACAAQNAQGETISNELHFRVKYTPSCRTPGVAVVGAARGETVVIVCEVDADPPAAVFKWKFNNSGETIDVNADKYTSNGSASSLRYMPIADVDYGTLSCSALNEIGLQTAPCVFQMVAAGKPHAPRNCTLWNQTTESVEVSCVAGFDGGLPQKFLLEVYTADERNPRMNLTSEEPSWTVRGLEWDVRFRLAVLALNAKGRSPSVTIDDILFRDPEKITASDTGGSFGAVGAAGAAAGVACTALAAACGLGLRRRARSRTSCKSIEHNHQQIINKATPLRDEPEPDPDPDIIPNNYTEVMSAPNQVVASPSISTSTPALSNGPGSSWTWGPRPRELAVGTSPSLCSTMGRSASAQLRAVDSLNVDAIKEKLLDHRIPESCV